MRSLEFVKKLKDIATNYNTIYVLGCVGAPLQSTPVNTIDYHCSRFDFNKSRASMYRAVSNKTPRYYGFDCVCLIKAILWGWTGDIKDSLGGAEYKSNGVPDIDCDTMYNKGYDKSTNFDKILPGELVWLDGHIGVYVGNDLAVECTSAWKNNVQFTACNTTKTGYQTRKWTAHCKCSYIDYSDQILDGDWVTVENGAKYSTGAAVPDMVLNDIWRVNTVTENYAQLGINEAETHNIISFVDKAHLKKTSRPTWNLKFVADDRVISTFMHTTPETECDIPTVPVKDGYVGSWPIFKVEPKDQVITALYKKAKHTAVFYASTEEIVAQIDFEEGSDRISEPAVPDWNGYYGVWEPYKLANSDLNIFAKYEPIEYKIDYVGLSESVDNPCVYNIETPTFILNMPQDERFEGFYLNGRKIESIETGTYGDLVLEARYKKDTGIFSTILKAIRRLLEIFLAKNEK